MLKLLTLAALLSSAVVFPEGNAFAEPAKQESWFLSAIHAPETGFLKQPGGKIVIAIVDDGVRITHRDLKPFIWKNPREIPGNGLDDDGNGYADDVHGWDVSDGNPSVVPPKSRQKDFYHGTHLAGIVAQIARRAFGEAAPQHIKILPVKALSDRARNFYLKEGYKGIQYAIDAGADIILCSWGVGHISAEETQVLKRAEEKGIQIVAAAGNLPEGRDQFPAAFASVLAVAALDREGMKIEKSNYGDFVDLAAPGIDIHSAHVDSDTGHEMRQGTSFSAPMVATAAALVKLRHPSYSRKQIEACLKSAATPTRHENTRYAGKLGAGLLNIEEAVECRLFTASTADHHLPHPEGFLSVQSAKNTYKSWKIQPAGHFNGIRFASQAVQGKPGNSLLNFYSAGSKKPRWVASHLLADLPETVFVPGASALVTFEADNPDVNLLLQYEAETIDFSRLHCSDLKHVDFAGTLEDGSGAHNYAFESDCKWLITAPEGKVVHFKFTEFDTEPRRDLVYFFNGAGTHEKIMAAYSGSKLPPELTTWSNQVLVWFVTDRENQGRGWKADVQFLEK